MPLTQILEVLQQPAIDQHLGLVELQHFLATGYVPGRPQEADFDHLRMILGDESQRDCGGSNSYH